MPFQQYADNHLRRSSPGTDSPPVAPSDTVDLEVAAKALRVFNTSDETKSISFRTLTGGDTTRTWKVSSGDTVIPLVVTRVLDTGTDNADLEIHAIID